MSQIDSVGVRPPYVLVSENGQTELFSLEADSNMFVGSGSNSKIRIQSPEVATIHCMLLMDSTSELKIADWNTGKTLVNGDVVTDTIEVNSGDVIEIGDARIVPVLDEAFHQSLQDECRNQGTGECDAESAIEAVAEAQSVSVETDIEIEAAQQSPAGEPAEQVSLSDRSNSERSNSDSSNSENGNVSIDPPAAKICNESFEVSRKSRAKVETEILDEVELADESDVPKNAFVYNVDGDLEDDRASDVPAAGFDYSAYSTAGDAQSSQEEAQLLRVEIDQLRHELGARDSLILQLRDSADRGGRIDNSQTEQLVNRLEDLLSELETSDDRIRGLEDLLRISDQANASEREERLQIENWVNELEVRISQRESEGKAEVERLTKRLQEANSARQQSEGQLQNVLEEKVDSGEAAPPQVVQDFQLQLQNLQQELETVRSENETLRTDLEGAESAQTAARLQETEQKLAEIQLETSRERAEMARRAAELQQLKNELEERLSRPRPTDEADAKIRAMRQHFNDIHEKEKAQKKKENRQTGLSSRIQNLLSRVGKR